MSAPALRKKLIKISIAIAFFGAVNWLAFQWRHPKQQPRSEVSTAPMDPVMDTLANFRLLAQGDIETTKYLLLERAYRHWSQLAVFSRSDSKGYFTEKLISVPSEKIDALLKQTPFAAFPYHFDFSESIWVRKNNTFLTRLTIWVDNDNETTDFEILADYDPREHKFTFRESSWKLILPGNPSLELSDR